MLKIHWTLNNIGQVQVDKHWLEWGKANFWKSIIRCITATMLYPLSNNTQLKSSETMRIFNKNSGCGADFRIT